jgi:type II secretory pathway component GspD/PulD (secretin)
MVDRRRFPGEGLFWGNQPAARYDRNQRSLISLSQSEGQAVNASATLRISKSPIACLAALLIAAWCSPSVQAADPTFVGVLALASEDDVAKELNLSDEVRERLLELIDQRELAALALVQRIRELSPEEKEAALAPFVAESERLGLALLMPDQVKRLRELQLLRRGLSALADPQFASRLQLSEDQQAEVDRLLAEREEKLAAAEEDRRSAIRADYERQLRGLLERSQAVAWDMLTGLGNGDGQGDQVAQNDGGQDRPADEQPAKETEPAEQAEPNDQTRPAEETRPGVASASEDKQDKDEDAPATPPEAKPDQKIRFSYQYTPWEDVIRDFAERAGLALVTEVYPPGTFNYIGRREFTPAEALDALNGVLLTKGFTLVRRDNMLTVVDLEEGVPPSWIEEVPYEKLDEVGKYELVKMRFSVRKMTAEDAAAAVERIIASQGENTQGSVAMLTPTQILVTETGGNLRLIRSMIDSVENPIEGTTVKTFDLEHATALEIVDVIRQLLGIAEEEWETEAGDLHFSPDPIGSKIYATGTPQMIDKLGAIIEAVDKPASALTAEGDTVIETPQLEVHEVKSDPETAKAIIETMLAGLPDVRMALDPATDNLVIWARPSQHKTVAATLKQLEAEQVTTEVIQLHRYDPASAILLINKLFGISEEEPSPAGLTIDGDPTTSRLFIRGKPAQIQQIKEVLAKMDPDPGTEADTKRQTVRILPLYGRQAQQMLEMADLLWPTTRRQNRIRIVPLHAGDGEADQPPIILRGSPEAPAEAAPQVPEQPQPRPRETEDKAARYHRSPRVPVRFASRLGESRRASASHRPTGRTSALTAERVAQLQRLGSVMLAQANQPQGKEAGQNSADGEKPEIVVTITPNGIVIASQDLDALDDYETLLRTLMTQDTTAALPTVFYLKFIKAEYAASLLTQMLGGGTTMTTTSSDVVGGMASAMLGDVAGGLLGGLLGGEEGTVATGSASIVADTNLNALIVQASPQDMEFIEIMLGELDRESSREKVLVNGMPRIIKVRYAPAEEIAAIVQTQFADQIASGGQQQGGGGRGQISPEDFIRALRGGGGGGRGGRGGGGNQAEQQRPQMRISVDARSNSLIVTAPEPLYQEVAALVADLDRVGTQSDETMVVVQLRRGNPEMVQKALQSMVGEVVTSSTAASGNQPSGGGGGEADRDRGGDEDAADALRRRIEAFRRGGGFGGRGGDGGGRGGGDFGGRGGGGFGGRGGGGFGGRGGGGDSGGGRGGA